MPTARMLWKATKANHKTFDDTKKFKGNFGPLLDKWEKLDHQYATLVNQANAMWLAGRKSGLDPKKKVDIEKKIKDIDKKVGAKGLECDKVLHQANEVAKAYLKIAEAAGDGTMRVDMHNVFVHLAHLSQNRYEDAIQLSRTLTPREILFKNIKPA